jgi:hypothetical protein
VSTEDRRGGNEERRGGPPLGSGPGASSAEPYLKTDPTLLTTRAILREVELLSEKVEVQLDGLREIHREKFAAIDKRFELVELQRLEQKADTKTAVDAALSAQKEAVKEQTTASELAISKSENATVKQLEQLGTTFKTTIEGVTTIVGDLKERVSRNETQVASVEGTHTIVLDLKERVGRMESLKVAAKDTFSSGLGVAGFLVALALFALAVVVAVT